MKQITILQAVFLLLSSFVFSVSYPQESEIDYDLSQFKLPYLKRQTLEFDFGLDANRLTSNREGDIFNEENKNLNFYLDFSTNYTYYLNTPKLQIEQYSRFRFPAYSFSKADYESDSYKTTLFNPNLYYSGTFREYLKGKFFIAQAPVLDFSYRGRNQLASVRDDTETIISEEDEETDQTTINFKMPLLVGWGRIERVEDARLAVYILDDLKKAGRLSREVSDEDIDQLAEQISVLQNERFFDNRLKEIWEMQQIDSVLKEMNLIQANDIVYFTLLKDNWDYAAGPIRNSGFRVSGGIVPELRFSRENSSESYEDLILGSTQTTFSNTKTTELGAGIQINLVYEKPINLYWQFSVAYQANLGRFANRVHFEDEVIEENQTDYIANELNNSLNLSFHYYPNSRTSLEMYTYSELGKIRRIQENWDDRITIYGESTLGIELQYYLSPRLRISGDANFLVRGRKFDEPVEDKTLRTDLNFSAGLIYKLR